MAELSQEQLEELVVGKPSPLSVTFYEKAMLDVEASKQAGQRVYLTTVYVQKKAPGVKDSVSYRATEQDKRAYPEEYQTFLNTRQGARKGVPIEIIPGLQLAHMQELLDLGIVTVEQLAEANTVPSHLDYARESAIALATALQEQEHGEEENQQEDRIEETREAAGMPAPRGREHAGRVRQPEAPPRQGDGDGEAPEGVRPGGRQHGGLQRVKYRNIVIA